MQVNTLVFLAVLFAAACHAGWNALIKMGLDPLSTATLIAVGSAGVGLVCLPVAGMPVSPGGHGSLPRPSFIYSISPR